MFDEFFFSSRTDRLAAYGQILGGVVRGLKTGRSAPVFAAGLAAQTALTLVSGNSEQAHESELLNTLCRAAGFADSSTGVLTGGGSHANHLGLMVAMDSHLKARSSGRFANWNVSERGLPPDAGRLRILCSKVVESEAARYGVLLGLGRDAVVGLDANGQFGLDVDELADHVYRMRKSGLEPFSVLASCGSTAFGSVDPLAAIAQVAHNDGLWLHVDMGIGGGILFARRRARILKGLGRADSIAIDFSTAFFQPPGTGALLLATPARLPFHSLPPEFAASGSSRALPLWLCLARIGQEKIGEMVDRVSELARETSAEMQKSGVLRVLLLSELGLVIFRFEGASGDVDSDAVTAAIPSKLGPSEVAVLELGRIDGRPCVRLAIQNPCLSENEVRDFAHKIAGCGKALQADFERVQVEPHT